LSIAGITPMCWLDMQLDNALSAVNQLIVQIESETQESSDART
jgi:hypothetical protein